MAKSTDEFDSDKFWAETKLRRDGARKMRHAGLLLLLFAEIITLVSLSCNIPIDIASPLNSIPILLGVMFGLTCLITGVLESY